MLNLMGCYEPRQRRDLTMAEAAEILGITERTFHRWGNRYEAEGTVGLTEPSKWVTLSLARLPILPQLTATAKSWLTEIG